MGCAGTKIDIRYKHFNKGKHGPFIYLSHGETVYSSEIDTDVKELQAMDSTRYLDLGLDNINQRDYNLLLNTNIKCIIVSPTTRCLETARLVLDSHPKKDYVRVIIHPWLIDIINGSYNVPLGIQKKRETYNKGGDILYDWSEFDKLYPNVDQQELFYLEFFDNYQTSDKEIVRLKSMLRNDFSYDLLIKLLGKFKERNLRPESMKSAFTRVQNFKNFLRHHAKATLTNKRDKIVVITHPYFINLSCLDKNVEVGDIDISSENAQVKINSLDVMSINVNE
jgi:broad specificity phosphatase PhoE